MSDNITIIGECRVIEEESIKRQKDSSISKMLKGLKSGLGTLTGAMDKFLSKRGIDMNKAIQSGKNRVENSIGGRAASKAYDKAAALVGNTKLVQNIKENGIKATIHDKLKQYDRSGTSPPDGEEKGMAGTLAGIGQTLFKDGKEKWKQRGLDVEKDYFTPGKELVQALDKAIKEFEGLVKDPDVIDVALKKSRDRMDNARARFEHYLNELKRIAEVGRELYDEAVKVDPNADKRILNAELAYKKLIVEDNKLKLREYKVNGGNDKKYEKQLQKEAKSSYKDFTKHEDYYNSLIQDPNDYGEKALAAGPGRDFLKSLRGGVFDDPIIGDMGKRAAKSLPGRYGRIAGALTGTGQSGERHAHRSTAGKILGGMWDAGKETVGIYGDGVKLGGSFLGTRAKVLGKNLVRVPFGLFETGWDRARDAYRDQELEDMTAENKAYDDRQSAFDNRWKKTREDFGSDEEFIAYQKQVDDYTKYSDEQKALGNDGYSEQERAELEEINKLKEQRDRNLKTIEKRKAEKEVRDKEREARKGKKGFLSKAIKATGVLGGIANFGKSILEDNAESLIDNVKAPFTASALATKVVEGDAEWVKEKAAREQERIDQVSDVKDEAKRRSEENMKKNKDNGLFGKLMGVIVGAGKFLFTGILGSMLKFIATKSMKFMFKGIRRLGEFMGGKILGGLANLGTKFASIFAPVTAVLKSIYTSVGGLLTAVKAKALGKIGELANKVKGGKIGGSAKSLWQKAKGSWLGRAVSWVGRTKVGGMIVTAAKWIGQRAVVIAGPIGWVVGIGLALWSAYKLYKWLTDDDKGYDVSKMHPALAITKLRLLAYGLGAENSNNYQRALELEENVGPYMHRDEHTGEVTFKEPEGEGLERLEACLDYSEENPELNESKKEWFNNRFIPTYKAFLTSLWGVNSKVKLAELDKLTNAELSTFVNNVSVPSSAFKVINLPFKDTRHTKVTKKEYDDFYSLVVNELKKRAKQSKDEDMRTIAARNDKTVQQTEFEAKQKFINANKQSKDSAEFMKNNSKQSTSTGANGLGAGIGGNGKYNIQKGGEFEFGQGKTGNVGAINEISLPDAMKQAADLTGVPEELLWTFAKIESSLNPAAKNKNSSATGLYQFLDGTWGDMIKKHGKKYGLTLQNASRYNPLHSAIMAGEYMRGNMHIAEKFKDVGVDLGTGLYLAHFMGPGGAEKAYNQMVKDPNISSKSFFADNVYSANFDVMKGRNLGQVIEYFQQKFYGEMKKDPTEFPQYQKHAKINPKLYENVGDIKYQANDNNFVIGKGNNRDVTAYGSVSEEELAAQVKSTNNLGTTYGGDPSTATVSGDIGHGNASYERNLKNWNSKGDNFSTDGKGREHLGVVPTDIREIYGTMEDGSAGGKGGVAIKIHPIAKGYKYRVSSLFGPRNLNVKGASKYHKGVDFAAPTGTPIVATGDGKVTVAQSLSGYGNAIYIAHGDGLVTRYAHLSAFKCRAGQEVKAGDVIGLCGNTGIGSGPHLHFEVRKGDTAIDPMKFSVIKNGNEGGEAEDKVKDGQIVDTNGIMEGNEGITSPTTDLINNTLDTKDKSLSQSVMGAPMGGGFAGMGGIDGMVESTMRNRAHEATGSAIGEDPVNVNGNAPDLTNVNEGTSKSNLEDRPIDVKVDQSEVVGGLDENAKQLAKIAELLTQLVTNSTGVQKFDTSEIVGKLDDVNKNMTNMNKVDPNAQKGPTVQNAKIQNNYSTGIDVSRNRNK